MSTNNSKKSSWQRAARVMAALALAGMVCGCVVEARGGVHCWHWGYCR